MHKPARFGKKRIEKEESGGGDGDGVPLWWSKMMMVQGLER
jgi:hypothetical protein